MGVSRRGLRGARLPLLMVVAVFAASSGAAKAAPCPNELLRVGLSAGLPDCRAYELVTPPNSNGRTFNALGTYTLGIPPDLFPTETAAPGSDSFIFMTFGGALAEPPGGSGVFDVYRAKRGVGGWSTTELLSPPSTTINWSIPGGVSADHTDSFTRVGGTGGGEGVDLLRLPDGSFEPTAGNGAILEPDAQGRYITPSGGHVIFSTGPEEITQSYWCSHETTFCKTRPLAPDAPPEGTGAVYDRPVGGAPHVVSLLPNEVTPTAGQQACYVGTSKNAASVAFKITANTQVCVHMQAGSATLYVRVHNGLPGAEETLEVAEGNPAFAGLSDDGRYLFYVTEGGKGTIHRLDTETATDLEINPGAPGQVVNISSDGDQVYYISEAQIGELGTAGQPNMYAWKAGAAVKFVATVAASDLVRTSGRLPGTPSLTNWSFAVTGAAAEYSSGADGSHESGPGNDSSRSTPDGNVLVFESKAQLTPYENSTTEIYRYEFSSGKLTCVSCNSVGPTAEGHESRLQEVHLVGPQAIIHNLSEDGTRVFFETAEALVPADVNGVNDVYEWHDGEVALISSGSFPVYPTPEEAEWQQLFGGNQHLQLFPNTLQGATSDGRSVFFSTNQALTPGAGENGTQAIYDARVDGGFPQPAPVSPCSEEGCKPPRGAISSDTLPSASEGIAGAGNIKPRKAKRRKRHCRRKRDGRSGRPVRCSTRSHGNSEKRGALEGTPAVARGLVSATSPESIASASEPQAEAPVLSASTAAAAPAVSGAEEPPFAIKAWTGSLSTSQAGSHPDFTTLLEFAHHPGNGGEVTNGAPEEVRIALPPGFLGNPRAVPTCSLGDFNLMAHCSSDSQIGITLVKTGAPGNIGAQWLPVFNLALPHPAEELARFGFFAYNWPVYIDIHVRTDGDYGVTAAIHDAPGLSSVIKAKTTLWADPASDAHNAQRANMAEIDGGGNCTEGKPCQAAGEERASTIPAGERKSFLSNPSACEEGAFGLEVTTYQHPGQRFGASAPMPAITDCSGLPFAPQFEAEPTSHLAGSPTGLITTMLVPQHPGEGERSTATMREARVTLPAGMQVAAGAANWIGTCSEEEVGYHKEVDAGCPDSSKLGTATIKSPDLPNPIAGTIYQRSPQPGHQLGLWLTSDALGLHIKLPGELEPDPQTGRLTAVFRDLPQVPVEEIDLNVWGGPRAPLQNPDHCGTFTTDFSFSPHSNDPAATGQSAMQITEGCNQGFSPTLKAGVTEPTAGKFSPFVFDLTRPDGDQALRGFDLKLPKGELAKIKGVPLCSDADAAAATCPQGSRIGGLQATTGPGPEPFTIPAPGKAQPQIFLSGPYQGSPFSIVSEVPAQAGPFDLGVLAVRSGLDVEPETGIAVVKADPLPQFFEGVGIAYRNLHAVVDRPEFNLNPTNCSELAVTSAVTSTQGTVAHPSARFQVDGCKALKFKPKLSLKLRGGTKRAQYPALSATLKAGKGDANIAFTSAALPHSEFIAQEHFDTICTRVQFAADKCPKGAIYGKAKAWTPLLEKPLSGPVYLRSSNHPLPDVVVKLGGQLEIDLVGRVDSVHGGLRVSFESVPDAPVSKFVLQMKGGKKGLFVNSTDICRGSHRATVRMKAQNGRVANFRTQLQSSGCGKKKLGKHHKHN